MTVCIAALAEQSKAIVLVADKRSTIGTMRDDTDVQKILPIGRSGWAALTAGDGGYCDAIVRNLVTNISNDPKIPKDAAKLGRTLEMEYRKIRDDTAEQEVLAPHFLTRGLWASRSKDIQQLPDAVVDDVRDDREKFEFGADLLVCGFDGSRKAHILLISTNGISVNVTNEGFFSIGNGSETAIGRMLWQNYRRRKRLERVLYEAFDAKAHAELIENVGYTWDAKILVPGRILTPPPKITSLIERVFSATIESPFERQPSHKPNLWRETLETYREGIFPEKKSKRKKR